MLCDDAHHALTSDSAMQAQLHRQPAPTACVHDPFIQHIRAGHIAAQSAQWCSKTDTAPVLLQSLGWSEADRDALCAPPAAPAADAAPAKANAAAKKAGNADKKAAASTDTTAAPLTEEVVTGLDVVCHVAAITSHRGALQQLEGNLIAAVEQLKEQVYGWQMDETANKERWAGYLNKLRDAK